MKIKTSVFYCCLSTAKSRQPFASSKCEFFIEFAKTNFRYFASCSKGNSVDIIRLFRCERTFENAKQNRCVFATFAKGIYRLARA